MGSSSFSETLHTNENQNAAFYGYMEVKTNESNNGKLRSLINTLKA